MLLVLLFGFEITNLTCHVVTLQSAVCVRFVVLKHKTDADIKEVILLVIYPIFTFTPYYAISPTSWEVGTNSMSSFW